MTSNNKIILLDRAVRADCPFVNSINRHWDHYSVDACTNIKIMKCTPNKMSVISMYIRITRVIQVTGLYIFKLYINFGQSGESWVPTKTL